MQVKLLSESGYDEAVLGFSLSYNTTIERAKEILPKYAFKNNGENKFLRVMITWWDITAPRFWLTELDTYKVATVRLSESTMRTICKKKLSETDFEYPVSKETLETLNNLINAYKICQTPEAKNYAFRLIKNNLPEGFLQRIVFSCSYATLQTIYSQRLNHRLIEWNQFLYNILGVSHPELILNPESGSVKEQQ